MEITKIFIWGTGSWAHNLLSALPNNYQVEAFIETNPSKAIFQGKRVLAAADYKYFGQQADYIIVAVANHETIKNFVWEKFHSFSKFRFMVLDEPVKLVSYKEEEFVLGKAEYVRPQPRYTVCDIQGISFVVNTKSAIMIKELSKNQTYQEEDIYKFFSLCDKYYERKKHTGGILLDIGANIGTTSIYIKKRVKPELIVHAFEPVNENCKMLKASLLLNDIPEDEYKLVQAALSNENGSAEIMVSENNIGNNVVVKGNNYEKGASTEGACMIRLDDYLQMNDIRGDEVKYIWMDVQAHEGFVLDGAPKLLANRIPLYMEIWPEGLKKNNSLDLLVAILVKNYQRFVCIHEGESEQPIPVKELKNYCNKYEKAWFDAFMIKD